MGAPRRGYSENCPAHPTRYGIARSRNDGKVTRDRPRWGIKGDARVTGWRVLEVGFEGLWASESGELCPIEEALRQYAGMGGRVGGARTQSLMEAKPLRWMTRRVVNMEDIHGTSQSGGKGTVFTGVQ